MIRNHIVKAIFMLCLTACAYAANAYEAKVPSHAHAHNTSTTSKYAEWINRWKDPTTPIFQFSEKKSFPVRLIVKRVMGDVYVPKTLPCITERGIQVSPDGRVRSFDRNSCWGSNAQGSGAPKFDPKHLDKLISMLPDDGSRLPPRRQRLMVQVIEGSKSTIRVYDLLFLPKPMSEILHLCDPLRLHFYELNAADR
jgi:hypothetical protein